MEEAEGIRYLRERCFNVGASDDALRQIWRDGQARLGPVIPGAGLPNLQPIPRSFDRYLNRVTRHPRYAATLNGMYPAFRQVEIRPLLTFQYHVEVTRAAAQAATGLTPGSLTQAVHLCLPDRPVAPRLVAVPPGLNTQKFISSELGTGPTEAGQFGDDTRDERAIIGIALSQLGPLVHVVHWDGRYYLRNGCHRASGLMAAGFTHMPAIVLRGRSFADVGATAPPNSFDEATLGSPNPPTCGHYDPALATGVSLREAQWIFELNWKVEFALEP